MSKSKSLNALIALVVLFGFSFIMGWTNDSARGAPKSAGSIGGKVQVSHGGSPAGVWVIADTTQILTNNGSPAHFRKIVVTDDKGNFLIPDLPSATYNVWVRGYGLADSTPVSVATGQNVTLHADPASTPQEAAQVYPGSYWLSLYQPPPTIAFPGTGPTGNGISTNMKSQAQWINTMKLGCELCHQLGSAETRDLLSPSDWDEAWNLAATMSATANGFGRLVYAQTLADWADRIDAGEVPPSPPRPQGIERNVVITQWEWGDQFTYAHDEVATDKRNPQLYPYGKVYGVDLGNDYIVMTDPVTNKSSRVHVPTLNGFNTPWCNQTYTPGVPPVGSPLPNGFCTWNVYVNPANPHNPMLDGNGKLWFTSQIRREWEADFPSFCLSDPVIANNRHHRQLAYIDVSNFDKPGGAQSTDFVLIDTCYGTHHLEFANDGKLWLSGDSFVVGWFDPSTFDPNNPATLQTSQGWSQVVVDSDGDGIPDTPIIGFHYGINVNPVDGSIWSSSPGYPGNIQRFDPITGKHEVYTPPAPYHGARGIDVDTNGIVWVGLAGTGALASFDRSKCVANNHTAGTGNQCPEGWAIYQYNDSPQMKGVTDPGGSDFHYLIFVDQHNTSGLGENTVFLTGTGSDSLIAFNQTTKKFSIIRIPYPLVAYMRGLDGRIDDPNAGWKGRGLWVDYGIDPIKHTETEFGQVYHVQFRPNPLAQ